MTSNAAVAKCTTCNSVITYSYKTNTWSHDKAPEPTHTATPQAGYTNPKH
jgi:hypothetical protein